MHLGSTEKEQSSRLSSFKIGKPGIEAWFTWTIPFWNSIEFIFFCGKWVIWSLLVHTCESGMRNWSASVIWCEIKVLHSQAWDLCFSDESWQGRDPLSQNFRKFRYKIKWNGIFRKLCFENSGQPLEVVLFSENLEIPEIFCCIWHSIIKSISPRRFLVSYPPQKRQCQYLLFGCNEWSPMWISYRHETSLDNFLAENMREVCTFPFSSENDF